MSDGGKGSKQRPTDLKKYQEGWDRIFGNSKKSSQSTQTAFQEHFDRAIMKNEYYDLDDKKSVDKN